MTLPAESPRGTASAQPHIGHVYLLRIDGVQERGSVIGPEEPLYVKLRVIDHAPERFVTFRWALVPEMREGS